jgi:site-specific recombinase XerD
MRDTSSVPLGSHQPLASFENLFCDYRDYAKHSRNVAEATVNEQKIYLTRFFQSLESPLSPLLLPTLSPGFIQHFLFEYARDYGPGSCRWMQFTLRSFFRFCYLRNYLEHDLSGAVPTMRSRRLSNVPKAIDDESTQKLLESIDLTTHIGIRNYAIIQLLTTYGVRGIQVRRLTLKDIEWRSNQIRFQAVKRGNPIVQHLTEETGNSLLTYIRSVRPDNVEHNEVFLTSCKPHRPFNTSGSFSSIIARCLKAADITLPEGTSRGTHSFRHAFAIRMLTKSTPLNFIADMLGHRDLSSTYLYSKVDFNGLSQAAMEWPEVNV